YYNFLSDQKLISGNEFDYIYWLQHGVKDELDSPFGTIQISPLDNKNLVVKIGEQDSVHFDMVLFKQNLLKHYQNRSLKRVDSQVNEDGDNVIVPADQMKLSEDSSNFRIEIQIQSISAVNSNGKSEPDYLP